MKKKFYLLILFLVFAITACTLHIPYENFDEYRQVIVVLNVVPDDAQVLLNGRYIGEAYEFSTPGSALRLSSRNNAIIIKKEGYIEEVVDLYDYPAQDITVRLTLHEEKDYTKEPLLPIPKTVKEKEIPEAPIEEEKIETLHAIKIILEIEPGDSAIYLDGKFWGISPVKGKIKNLKLKTGKYTLEIVKPGYKAYKKELELSDQNEVKLSIKLIK